MSVMTRDLRMHPKLLLDVIQRQAGSLHKAILEGVMNGIEAGASRIDIQFAVADRNRETVAKLKIKDNGKGIPTQDAIERFFETFGTPHDESEGKIWAQFRMGRGQLFAFGKNVWRTGTFRMSVDVKNQGLQYGLETNLKNYEGCEIDIELYVNPTYVNYNSVEALLSNVAEQVEFMNIPIYFNGKKISNDPEELTWTHEDENAYYLFGKGVDLAVYNLGAFVMKLPENRAGVNGIIVSKKQLKINFARNDIQSDCEVYEKIQKVIAKNRRAKIRRNRSTPLNRSERIAVLTDLRDGEISYDNEISSRSLIETTSGRCMKLSDIVKIRVPWSFGAANDIRSDKLMQSGQAVIFDETLLSALRFKEGDESTFFTWLLKNALPPADYDIKHERSAWRVLEKLYKPIKEVQHGLSESYVRIDPVKFSPAERYALKTLEDLNCWEGRVLTLGVSTTALAWTDGESYITIERDFFDNCLKYRRYGRLFSVLVHELAHDINTEGTHGHTEEFYRRFHDLCVYVSNPIHENVATFGSRLERSKTMQQKEERAARIEKKEKAARKALTV